MKGIDGGYKLSELLFGRGGSADAIVNVAAESSERQCRICSVSLLRFWHIALIVILIILREKEFWAH